MLATAMSVLMVDGNGVECVDGGGFPMVGWDSVTVYLCNSKKQPGARGTWVG